MVRARLTVSLVRTALLLLALAAGTGLVWQLVQAPLAEVRSVVTEAGSTGILDLPVDRALAAISAAALAGCWLWLALSVLAVLADAVAVAVRPRRRAGGHRWVPAGLRRVVLACSGLALVGSLAAPAHADTPFHTQATHARTDGLPLPDRALGGPPAAAGRVPETASSVVTVRAGDTLWAIARRFLPPGATTTEIAAAWQRIARDNADRLRAGPDLIYPGTRLRVPRPLDSKGAHHDEDRS